MKRTDIKIGYACNNRCSFCVQGDKRLRIKQKTFEEIKDILDKEYDLGVEGVVFTGGEPTIHESILECINYAREKGFKSIMLQSNGRTFKDMDFLKKLIDAGVGEFGPSIHGFKSETHDMLVNSPGAFEETMQGIKNLKELGQVICVNIVITKRNYQELPHLAQLLCSLGVDQFQLAFVHIMGSAEKYKEDVVAKKSDIMPYVELALDIGKAAGVSCMTEAIPFCMMKGYEWAIAEYNYNQEVSVFDAEYTMKSYSEYRLNNGKAKREECKKCIKNNICEGPWKEYPEMYGWDEFIPIES